MSKPQPTRFPSDDFTVTINGETYHPHEGEWVELFPDQTVKELIGTASLARYGAMIQAAKGDPDAALQIMSALGGQYDVICAQLADRVMDWTWTDRRGNPMPKPDGTPGPIGRLTDPEIAYLLSLKASKQETDADRKNG